MQENTDVALENKVLATLMLEERSRESITKIIPSVFHYAENRALFSVLKNLHLSRSPIDMIYINANHGNEVSALKLIEIWDDRNRLPREMFEWAIKHLRHLLYLRVSLDVSHKIALASQSGDSEKTVKMAMSLTKAHRALTHEEDKRDVIEAAVATINSSEEYIPFSTPLCRTKFGGWTRRDMSSIGGKSGHNKTTFALYDAVTSIKQGSVRKILYFAVDEPGEMIVRRIIANDLDVSLTAMRNKSITLDANEIKSALNAIYGDRFIIIDNVRTADEIVQAILDICPDRSIIDHIQELDYGEQGISDQKVMVAAGKLKHAAKISNGNVTVLSQVRDKLIDERFEDKIPRPHDFLYASDLRRKSREQSVVYWEYKDSQDELSMDTFDFIVWKSTYSETGKVKFSINPDKARFDERLFTRQSGERATTEKDIWKDL